MAEMKRLHERLMEAARLLGSDEVAWCPSDRLCGTIPNSIDENGLDTCQQCWLTYLETGE